jgi:hypothetical protein
MQAGKKCRKGQQEKQQSFGHKTKFFARQASKIHNMYLQHILF